MRDWKNRDDKVYMLAEAINKHEAKRKAEKKRKESSGRLHFFSVTENKR